MFDIMNERKKSANMMNKIQSRDTKGVYESAFTRSSFVYVIGILIKNAE